MAVVEGSRSGGVEAGQGGGRLEAALSARGALVGRESPGHLARGRRTEAGDAGAGIIWNRGSLFSARKSFCIDLQRWL